MKTSPPLVWPDDYKSWTGTIKDLADAAAQVLASLEPGVKPPNIRLLRYYQQSGVVGRGRKEGGQAVFGFEDLERVVAAKGLVKQNWTLDQAVNLMDSHPAPVSSLLYGSLDAPVSPDQEPRLSASVSPRPASASDVVARLMARSTFPPSPALRPLLGAAAGARVQSVSGSVLPGAATNSAARSVASLPPVSDVKAVQASPWMTVYLDEAAARRASPADRQAAVDALWSALRSLS